ncbi:hypothetical protein LXA43DRAFT_976224 [Ganoderma leucocontextum]|nr:hypothetical protein LXA43DRAFT_976224 [Ganoderma leucocontextum]
MRLQTFALPRVAVASTILALYTAAALSSASTSDSAQQSVGATVISNDNPLIHFHGRWDASPGTWWVGSGFKLHVEGLTSLTLNLGPHTTSPLASIGVSVDFEPFYTVNVTQGSNAIPLRRGSIPTTTAPAGSSESEVGTKKTTNRSVVRINVEGWQDNRINLETIVLNKGSKLLSYVPSKLAFQFIGDSLSAGQYLPQGVNQAWPFLTGEFFKAEHNINAQPGAALTDIVSYGNQHGVSYHANDASQNVTADAFVQTFVTFLGRLRGLYPAAPFFVFTPWGWPSADGSISYYYDGQYERIVDERHQAGDVSTFLVNTTGWVAWDNVFPDNQHTNVPGHQKIAGLFEKWLSDWGL